MTVPANKGRRYPAEPLTQEEVRRLIAAALGRGPLGLRNRALIAVIWRSGLRISEALALHPRDVDELRGTVHVREGKGRKSRFAVIDTEALAHLRAWLEIRRQLNVDRRTSPIFCTIAVSQGIAARGRGGQVTHQPGQPLDSAYVRRLLPKLARRAGIEKRVHPHGLRHTHATELVERRVPLHVIAGQLGHSSTATTDTYLAKLAPQERMDAMRAAGWTLDPPPDTPATLPDDQLF